MTKRYCDWCNKEILTTYYFMQVGMSNGESHQSWEVCAECLRDFNRFRVDKKH